MTLETTVGKTASYNIRLMVVLFESPEPVVVLNIKGQIKTADQWALKWGSYPGEPGVTPSTCSRG